jgi:hypothetical protein
MSKFQQSWAIMRFNCPDTFSKRCKLLDLSKSDLAGNLAVIYLYVWRVAGQLLEWSQAVF